MESAKRRKGIKMVSTQKWAPRTLAPSHEHWGPVMSTCRSSPCFPREPAGSRPALPAGSDVLTSRNVSCSPGHPPSSARQIGGALEPRWRGGGASGLSWRAEKFALYQQPQFRRPPLTKPCVLAWVQLSRERGPFSSRQSHFLLSQAPGACVCLRRASFELVQRNCTDSPGPGGLTWHSFGRL